MILRKDYIDTIWGIKFKYDQATIKDVLEYNDYNSIEWNTVIDWTIKFLEEHQVKTLFKRKLPRNYKIQIIMEWQDVFKHIEKNFFVWVKFWKKEVKKEKKTMDFKTIMSALNNWEKKEEERAERPLVALLAMISNYYSTPVKDIWNLTWEEVFDEKNWLFYAMVFNLNEETKEWREHNLKKQQDDEFAKKKKQLMQDHKNLKKYKDANKRSQTRTKK